MNRFALGLVLALAIAAGGYYLVSSQANVDDAATVAEKVKDKAKDLAADATEKAKVAAEKTKEVAAKTTEVAKEAAAKTAEVAKDAAKAVTEKAADAAETAKAKLDEAKKTVVADAAKEEKDAAASDGPENFGPNKDKEYVDGKWEDEEGMPTFNINKDGEAVKQVDWYTYSGWRRYHAECHVCHGPNGEGSTFAPALSDSLQRMDYAKFLQVVSSGQQNVWGRNNSIMPALGDNKNVMCFIDDIYVYLRARSAGVMPAGKLSAGQRAKKPKEARDFEKECFDG